MAFHGFDFPDSKSNEDHALCQEIFDKNCTLCDVTGWYRYSEAIFYDREAVLVGILFDDAKRYACDQTAKGRKERCHRCTNTSPPEEVFHVLLMQQHCRCSSRAHSVHDYSGQVTVISAFAWIMAKHGSNEDTCFPGWNILTETLNIRHLFQIRFESRVLQQTKAPFTVSTILFCMSLSPTYVVFIPQSGKPTGRYECQWGFSSSQSLQSVGACWPSPILLPLQNSIVQWHLLVLPGTSVWQLPSTWCVRGWMLQI